MADVPPPKPWSVDIFQQYRAHLSSFVDENIVPLIRADRCRRILVRAPVKSGKREIAEYTALRDLVTGEPIRVHAFVSAWHRVADDEQRNELKQHNLHVFSIVSGSKAIECIGWIETQINEGHHVVIHLDECDHGAGATQILGKIWRHIREKQSSVTTVLYSATPEEVLYSGQAGQVEDADFQNMVEEMLSAGDYVRYTPPEGFYGPAKFIDEGLVEEATPFFRKLDGKNFTLTPQGRQICDDLRRSIATNPTRNIVVLRLSYSDLGKGQTDRKQNKSIYQFLQNIDQIVGNDFLVIVDKDEKFEHRSQRVMPDRIQWANPVYWQLKATGVPILVIIDQTSSRSTEWRCHNRIFATHEFRNILQFGTISQAQERVNHYHGRYGGFQPIKVYGNVKTFLLSAGRINYETYLTNEWYSRKVRDEELYNIKNTSTDELHPECASGPVSREEADRILQECASYADASLSARVRGSVKNVVRVRTTWHPCDTDTFQTVSTSQEFVEQAGNHQFQNPFNAVHMDGDRFQGYLRGWSVLEYSRDVEQSRWGFNTTTNAPRVTVCYRDGVLGVALRTIVGFETQNTLTAFRSMYKE
jgi:hypothetical protein